LPALLAQHFVAALAHEQGAPDLLLQSMHLLGDRRLRPVERGARGGEGPVVVDGDEGAQQVEVEVGGHGRTIETTGADIFLGGSSCEPLAGHTGSVAG
jgi:hypothetical protein